jgi:hypothetical protein
VCIVIFAYRMIRHTLFKIRKGLKRLLVTLFWNIPAILVTFISHIWCYMSHPSYRTIRSIASKRSDRWSINKSLEVWELCEKYKIRNISYYKGRPIYKSDLVVLDGKCCTHWISVCSCCDRIAVHQWTSESIDDR